MKKIMVLFSYLALLAAWIFLCRGDYLASGIALLLVGISGVRLRWNETHDTLYTVGSAIVFVFILLHITWWAPRGIIPIGWIFLSLVGWIMLEIYQKTKNDELP